jgi:hypothetical protein
MRTSYKTVEAIVPAFDDVTSGSHSVTKVRAAIPRCRCEASRSALRSAGQTVVHRSALDIYVRSK